ncbi:MAG: hypothetical protein ACE5JG_02995, partial [Planctomycetota bacterium]
NPFSNQAALFKMSDGSTCRINEFRRVGHPGAVRMALFGTRAGAQRYLLRRQLSGRPPGT